MIEVDGLSSHAVNLISQSRPGFSKHPHAASGGQDDPVGLVFHHLGVVPDLGLIQPEVEAAQKPCKVRRHVQLSEGLPDTVSPA
jgi:hypothetical protein